MILAEVQQIRPGKPRQISYCGYLGTLARFPESLPFPVQLHRPVLVKTAQTRLSGRPECAADRPGHHQL